MFTYYDFEIENEKYNVLEEHHDVFKNELSINSYHMTVIDKSVIHEGVPLDVVYKSNPAKEAFYLTYAFSAGKGIPTYLRLNIDGRETIEIEVDDSLEDTLDKDSYWGYGHRVYFEITKEQLYKLCLANSLAVQISDYHDSVMKECSANGFITVLQALYNRVVDNTVFCDSREMAASYYNDSNGYYCYGEKEKYEKNKIEAERREKSERGSKIALIVVGILLALIGIIIFSGADFGSTDSGFGIAILFSVLFFFTGLVLFIYGLVRD